MDPLLLVMLVVLFGGMWWMSNRTRKQQQAATAFRDSLQPGQEVMTGSGMYGTVVDVEGDVVILETSPGQHTRWFKPAIAKLVEVPADEAPAEDELADDEYDDEYDDTEYDDEYDDEYEEDVADEGDETAPDADADVEPKGTDAEDTRRD